MGEGFRDAEPPHDKEGYMINDTGLPGFTAIKGRPSGFDLKWKRFYQQVFLGQVLPQYIDA